MGNENSRPGGEANLDKEEIQVRINEPVVTAAHGKIHRLHNAKAAPIEPASLQGSGFFYHPDLRALKAKGVIQRVGAKKLPPKLGHAPKDSAGSAGGEGSGGGEGESLEEHKSNIPQGTPVELFYARPKGSGRVFYIKSDNRSARVNTSVRSAYPYYPPKPAVETDEPAEDTEHGSSVCIRPPVFSEPSFTHRELYSESGAMARQTRLDERKQDYASPAEARVIEDRQKEKEEVERQQQQQQQQQEQEQEAERARKEQEEQAQKYEDAKRQQQRKEQEERAAVKIQSSWRGLQGRREGERRREERRQALDRNRQRRATGTWEDVDEFGVIALPKPAPGQESHADDQNKLAPVEEEPAEEEKKIPSTPLPELLTQSIPATDGDNNEDLVSYSKSLLKSMPSDAPAETEHCEAWLARIKELRVIWKKTIRQWEKDFAAENDRKPEKADKMSIKSWYLFDKKLKEKEGLAQGWVDASVSADAPAPSAPAPRGAPPSAPAPSAPPPSAPAPSGPPPSGPAPSGPAPSGPPPSGPPPSGPAPSGPPPSGPPPSGPAPSGPAPSGPPPSGPAPSGPAPSGPAPSGPPPSGPAPSGPPPSGPAPSGPPPSAPSAPPPSAPSAPPPSAPESKAPAAEAPPADGESADKPSTLVDAIPPGSQPDDLHAFTKLLLSQSKNGDESGMKDEWVARIKELRLVWKKTIRQWEKDFAAENDRKPEQADKMSIKSWYVNDKKLKKQLEALTA